MFDALMARSDFEAAAAANELARIKLESGDIDGAANWYKIGYAAAIRKTEMKDADKNLWVFRWAHAQARIAARAADSATKHRCRLPRPKWRSRRRTIQTRHQLGLPAR